MLLIFAAPAVLSECAWEQGVQYIEFASSAVQLQMRDSEGASTDAPFPGGGSIRWTHIGQIDGRDFDLLVTLHAESHSSYVAPNIGQGFLYNGFACLGVAVMTTTCSNGGVLEAEHAICDGEESALEINGDIFNFAFVETGTTQPISQIGRFVVTLYDIDGEAESGAGGNLFEMVAIEAEGETARPVHSPAASIDVDALSGHPTQLASILGVGPGAYYAAARDAVNVPNPNTPEAPGPGAVDAVVMFEMERVASFKVMMAGRSSIEGRSNRGFCFSMKVVSSVVSSAIVSSAEQWHTEQCHTS